MKLSTPRLLQTLSIGATLAALFLLLFLGEKALLGVVIALFVALALCHCHVALGNARIAALEDRVDHFAGEIVAKFRQTK